MAFCPECGKPAAPESTRCIHCGHELENKAAAGARFKGTMMMAVPSTAKAAAQPAVAGATPTPAAPPAAAPLAAAVAAQAPAKKGAAKQTMIGTGIAPLPGAKPATAPEAAPAARNAAFAQTQHQAAFAATPTPVAAPVELAIAPTPMAPRPEDVPEPVPVPVPEQPQYAAPNAGNQPLSPDDPSRSPVLRYDDSMPELPRHNPLQDKKTLWIAAGAIGFVCLILLIVLVSKLMS